MKKTALHERHIGLNAKMVEFAGYEMPIRYSSLQEEHKCVRDSVGVFDVSHMGEFLIKGSQALSLIQKVSSNDASKLNPGQAQYSCLPNNEGGIIDDLIIYCINAEEYMLVVNASNIEKDWNWIKNQNSENAEMIDQSDDMSLLAIQGPQASNLLQNITDVNLSEIPYYSFMIGNIGGVDDVIISATGYTGSGGFELYVSNKNALTLWDAIFNIKSDIKVSPVGLGARDTLRLEMGYCLYGNDIDDTTSPIEAGLSWITKFNHNFTNCNNLQKQKIEGVDRKLVGFEMIDKGIPRKGYDILNQDGLIIGKVTSGGISPMLEKGIGLGYINVPYHKKETPIKIQIRKKQIEGIIKRPPFIEM